MTAPSDPSELSDLQQEIENLRRFMADNPTMAASLESLLHEKQVDVQLSEVGL